MDFNIKEQKIKFYPESKLVKEVIPPPQIITPPKWFKDTPIYQRIEPENINDRLIVEGGVPNYGAKSCMPFLDSMTTGYSLNLWCDIQVKIYSDGLQRITWGSQVMGIDPVASRPAPDGFPVPNGFTPLIFSWKSHWGIQTPKGYSCLFTHPFNRTDLPFLTSTGIMDTDKWGIWGNQPFHIEKDWEGVIEAGTPLIHIYPFKRDNWKSEIDDSLTEWANYENVRRSSKFRGYYKNNYWSKKSFK
jgi:hypothetical protein